MKNGLNPARRVITKLGGEAAVSAGTGIPIDTLWRWQRPKGRGGTGGHIPRTRRSKLRKYAASIGVSLHPLELIEEYRLFAEMKQAS